MPYIAENKRPQIDKVIKPIIDLIRRSDEEVQDGYLNYTITRIIHEVYPRRYRHMNRAIGMLHAVIYEYYRRVVSPYEDGAINRNGDI